MFDKLKELLKQWELNITAEVKPSSTDSSQSTQPTIGSRVKEKVQDVKSDTSRLTKKAKKEAKHLKDEAKAVVKDNLPM